MPTWLGKAEGHAAIGLTLFLGLCLLLAVHCVDGNQFVSAFQILVVSYFGGSAVAAFRDFKKNGGTAGG